MIRRCAVSTKTSSPFYAHGFSSVAGMTFHVHDTVRCVYFMNRHCIALSVQPQGECVTLVVVHPGFHTSYGSSHVREILHEVYHFGWSCMPKACWARLDQAARRLKKLVFLSVTSTPGEPTGALTSLADADPLVTDGATSSGMHWPVGNQAVVLKPPLLTCPLTTCVRVPVTGLRVISRRCPPLQHT